MPRSSTTRPCPSRIHAPSLARRPLPAVAGPAIATASSMPTRPARHDRSMASAYPAAQDGGKAHGGAPGERRGVAATRRSHPRDRRCHVADPHRNAARSNLPMARLVWMIDARMRHVPTIAIVLVWLALMATLVRREHVARGLDASVLPAVDARTAPPRDVVDWFG